MGCRAETLKCIYTLRYLDHQRYYTNMPHVLFMPENGIIARLTALGKRAQRL